MLVKCVTAEPKQDFSLEQALQAKQKKSDNDTKKVKLENGLDDPLLERNCCTLFKNYLKGMFIFGAIANLPILVYDSYQGFPAFEDQQNFNVNDSPIYAICMLLKIVRLVQLTSLTKALGRLKSILSHYYI